MIFSQLSSAICTLRGEVLLALDSRTRAVEWFIQALLIDLNSVDAFNILLSRELLTLSQKKLLMKKLERRGEKERMKKEEVERDKCNGNIVELEKSIRNEKNGTIKRNEEESQRIDNRSKWITDYYTCAIKSSSNHILKQKKVV